MSTKSISVSWRLSKRFLIALRKLKEAECSDNGDRTVVAALRMCIIYGWANYFPGTPFPKDTDEEPNHGSG